MHACNMIHGGPFGRHDEVWSCACELCDKARKDRISKRGPRWAAKRGRFVLRVGKWLRKGEGR